MAGTLCVFMCAQDMPAVWDDVWIFLVTTGIMVGAILISACIVAMALYRDNDNPYPRRPPEQTGQGPSAA